MNFSQRIITALSCALLAACGGGGSGTDTKTQAVQQLNLCEQMPASSATQVQLAATRGLFSYQASGNAIDDMNAFTNQKRSEVGLPALTVNSQVAAAAAAHANYMALNQTLTHYETAGLAGYTATSPFERIDQFYSGALSYSGEIASAMSGRGSSGDGAIQALFDAPLHRVVMLSEYELMGSGFASSAVGVNYANQDYANYQAGIADFALVAYPYAGAKNIPATWLDSETPDPLAGTSYSNQTVGYPITIQSNLNSQLTLGKIKVYANCESELTLVSRSHANDPEIVHSENVLVAVPVQALKAKTEYTVWATGYYTSSSKTLVPFDVRWKFTTQ